jgi:hypothetical protein
MYCNNSLVIWSWQYPCQKGSWRVCLKCFQWTNTFDLQRPLSLSSLSNQNQSLRETYTHKVSFISTESKERGLSVFQKWKVCEYPFFIFFEWRQFFNFIEDPHPKFKKSERWSEGGYFPWNYKNHKATNWTCHIKSCLTSRNVNFNFYIHFRFSFEE